MQYTRTFHSLRAHLIFAAIPVFAMLLAATIVVGQEVVEKPSLSQQLRELQAKVATLEAALKKTHQTHASEDQKTMKMGKMQGGMMGGMKMMKGGMMGGQMKRKSGMGSMQSGQSKGGMGMGGMKMGGMGMMQGKGMSMMGKMKGMGQMQMPSTLPGFAGASHIYHIGSTDFFLDHPQHISLSQEQQTKLNQIKQKSLMGQATLDRQIAAAEQELWLLTSADTPDATKIEAKVREVEKLSADKRIAFIRAVGKAAQVLTDEQRKTLVGMLPPEHKRLDADSQN